MLSRPTRFTTVEAFNAILLSTILESEGPDPKMYLDNARPQNATIGIGFNLTNPEILGKVMKGFGYEDGYTRILIEEGSAYSVVRDTGREKICPVVQSGWRIAA